MNQKIEWYKEVLALEPGSKVFFPLARMQAENGSPEDALATLRHGLSRNPEHIEARLLLIDILFNEASYDALWPELDQIALMLGGYPGFWAAWNARLARNPSSRDASLALSFFSATLRGEAVSWSDVIEKGLRQLLSPAVQEGAKIATPKIAPPELGELKSYLSEHGQKQPVEADFDSEPSVSPGVSGTAFELATEDAPVDSGADADFDVAGSVSVKTGAANAPGMADALEAVQALRATAGHVEDSLDSDLEALDGDDESFTLKTRSMAEVLAEQGDYAGALDIYEDLLRQAESADDKHDIEAAMVALSVKAGEKAGENAAQGLEQASDSGEETPAGQGKNRLMDVLEALAQRLEARS